MKSMAVINQKGGCGKTTVAINLSACLAIQGQRTLLVDMDPQSHCAVGLAVPEDQIERNIYDVLIADRAQTNVALQNVVWQVSQDFDLAPSAIELAALEQQLAGQDGREECLRDVLARQGQDYDFVIIDCPPSIGLLTFNALRAADEVIIPVETGYFALHGLARQLDTIEVLRQRCQQDFVIQVVPSMYDVRTKLAREILGELRKHYQTQLSQTVVNFNTKLKEAASFGQAITEYDPTSKGMKDFMALAQEFIRGVEPGPAAKSEVAVSHVASAAAVDTSQAIQTAGADSAGIVEQIEYEHIRESAAISKDIASIDSQLESIGETADELMAASQEMTPTSQGESAKKQTATLQEKIDNFYGVRQGEKSVQFVALYPRAGKVQLAGDFNNWHPEQTELKRIGADGRWSIEMPLNTGVYRYRYVVDERWQQDPYNERVESNPYGELNSILEVK